MQTCPAGVHGPMLILLVPLEFFSNIVVRPITLALRLFANMFAGHILLVLFSTGGVYLLLHGGALVKPVGLLAWVLAIADQLPGDPGAVPAGLRLRPAQRHVHLRCARRRALRALISTRQGNNRKETAVEGSVNMVGYGLAAIGPGVGIGLIFAAYINGVARQPEAQSRLQSIAILGFALAEALAIIGIALAFVL